MSRRREFTPTQKRQIVERSKNERGEICCERCHQVLAGKPHEIDHIIPEGDRPEADKKKKLTIAEGQLLGKDCCHRGEDGKTNQDIKRIAKGNRRIDKHNGIKKPSSALRGRSREEKAAAREARAVTKLPLPPRRLFERGSIWPASTNPDIHDSSE